MKTLPPLAVVCSFLFLPASIAVTVSKPELDETRSWVAAKFEGIPEKRAAEPGLIVLEQHHPRPFTKNKHPRFGSPLKINGQTYEHGLFCHAPSQVFVSLPAPGKTFSALAGIDSNDESKEGTGSVYFSVRVGDQPLFRSEILREGMPPKNFLVDLKGATHFTLEVSDAGDGHVLDQSAWVNAKVVLQDGSTAWLDELPLVPGPVRHAYNNELPFSFVYDGKNSRDILKNWRFKRDIRVIDESRTEWTLTYTEPQSGLTLRCVSVEYKDFPTVEWTLYLKNNGSAGTPLISDIRALDLTLERSGKSEFVLHHHKGTFVRADDFEPLTSTLRPGEKMRFVPPGGRPLGAVFPYYNIEWSGEGAIVVIGWPGQWSAEFARDNQNGLKIVAGQELTRLILHPGEEIRTPLVVLQFYKGDWIRAQNVWRRWMMAHNLPREDGKLPGPLLTPCSSHQFSEMINANEENQKFFINRYIEEGLKPDYWWMDAGWYVNKTGWPNTGTWEVDLKRFPRGLRAISDHAHSKGVKTILWFEPERVTPGTWLYEKHPEWLLKGTLLNLGNPKARQWITDHVDNLMKEQGIDLYRQDYNMDPLTYWRGNDADDRQGITENHYVTGYLAYWDELRRRHPGMLIDSCASGGHRNDLETMRRALPFLRSDFIQDPAGNQGHTYGLSFWLPYHGTGSHQTEPYELLSAMDCPHFIACWDMRNPNIDYSLLRRLVNQWRDYAPLYFADYYPLTPYSVSQDAWLAWQFDQPERGKGMVQVFRRTRSFYESARFKLNGIDPQATYLVTQLEDAPRKQEIKGEELLKNGLQVVLARQPSAVVILYQRLAN